MKTKEEVVNGIVARFKHEIENVWANGYLSGYNDGRDSTKLFTGTEIPEYQRGLDDAFNTMTAVVNMNDEYREAVHGKWIDETFEPWGLVFRPYKCNQCGEHSEIDSEYCPHCGAIMKA